eukprot:scaffold187974_cov43-Tisochrysis_lutea.AAC.3
MRNAALSAGSARERERPLIEGVPEGVSTCPHRRTSGSAVLPSGARSRSSERTLVARAPAAAPVAR